MTELVPTAVTGALAKANAKVADVLKAAVADAPKVEVADTPVPKSPELTEDAEHAVRHVLGKLQALRLPSTRRQLSPDELFEVMDTFIDLDEAVKALGSSKEQIKAALFNHFDQVAVQNGKITQDTRLTKEGWAIVEDKTSGIVEGLPKKATREVRGGTPSLTAEALAELAASGAIEHDDYLAMTRQTRVSEEAYVLEWLRKNPAKAATLATAVTTTTPSAALYLRDNR